MRWRSATSERPVREREQRQRETDRGRQKKWNRTAGTAPDIEGAVSRVARAARAATRKRCYAAARSTSMSLNTRSSQVPRVCRKRVKPPCTRYTNVWGRRYACGISARQAVRETLESVRQPDQRAKGWRRHAWPVLAPRSSWLAGPAGHGAVAVAAKAAGIQAASWEHWQCFTANTAYF